MEMWWQLRSIKAARLVYSAQGQKHWTCGAQLEEAQINVNLIPRSIGNARKDYTSYSWRFERCGWEIQHIKVIHRLCEWSKLINYTTRIPVKNKDENAASGATIFYSIIKVKDGNVSRMLWNHQITMIRFLWKRKWLNLEKSILQTYRRRLFWNLNWK